MLVCINIYMLASTNIHGLGFFRVNKPRYLSSLHPSLYGVHMVAIYNCTIWHSIRPVTFNSAARLRVRLK